MCAPASGPIKHQIGDDKPMRQASPVLGHPPPLLDDVSDLLASGDEVRHLLKFGEDIMCRRMISHDPQREEKGKEPENMQEQHDALG